MMKFSHPELGIVAFLALKMDETYEYLNQNRDIHQAEPGIQNIHNGDINLVISIK